MLDCIPELGFDAERESLIEPAKLIKHRDLPEHCVLCFFRDVIQVSEIKLELRPLSPVHSEMGDIPVFLGSHHGQAIGIVPAVIGAPFAASQLEELIARGGRKFIVCGAAGVLDSSIRRDRIVVPTSALRDEGTSYHYLPPGREAQPSPQAINAVIRVLHRHKADYVMGKTWTTDAFYRETPRRVATRIQQGCLTVEMEASALFAVAEFRNVQIAQLLYGDDDVSGIEWDPREIDHPLGAREKLFWLAIEACLEIRVP